MKCHNSFVDSAKAQNENPFGSYHVVLFQVEKYESETPLAFAILVHNQMGQFEALLGSLFRPQNSYCIYLDQKTTEEFKSEVQQLVSNYKAKFPLVS